MTAEETKLLRFPLPELFAAENRRKTFAVMALATSAIIGYWAVLSWIPAWINQLTGTLAVDERSAAAIALNLGGILSAAITGLIVERLGRAGAFRLSFAGALASTTSMFLAVKSFRSILLAWVFAACAAVAGGQLIGIFGGFYARAGAAIALFYGIGFVTSFIMPETSGETTEERDSRCAMAIGVTDGGARLAPVLIERLSR